MCIGIAGAGTTAPATPVTTQSTPTGPHLLIKSSLGILGSFPLNQLVQAEERRRTSVEVRTQSSSMCFLIRATTRAATPAAWNGTCVELRAQRALHTTYKNSNRSKVHNSANSCVGAQTRWSSASKTCASLGGLVPPMISQRSRNQSTAGRTVSHSMKRCVRVSGFCEQHAAVQ